MELTLLANCLKLVVACLLPLFIAVGVGELLASLLRVSTQLGDKAVSFIGRFAGLCLVLVWASNSIGSKVLQFASRIWNEQSFYH